MPKKRDIDAYGDDEMTKCPRCGYVADLGNFDVGGADYGCVFCNRCHTEFDPFTGAVILKPGEQGQLFSGEAARE